jgi:hypothetical protein
MPVIAAPGDEEHGLLRASPIQGFARQDGRVGQDHGAGNHSIPGLEGDGHLRQLSRRDDDSVYVWLRRFESEAEREAQYKAVYESDHWKNEIAPRVPSCLDRSAIVVTRIIPTAKSTMR